MTEILSDVKGEFQAIIASIPFSFDSGELETFLFLEKMSLLPRDSGASNKTCCWGFWQFAFLIIQEFNWYRGLHQVCWK